MITIFHLIEPVVDSFLKYGDGISQLVPTVRHADGIWVQADRWLNTPTKSGWEALATQYGVRWTPLLRLPYWDPVKHVMLGFMHNLLEGILENHLHILWGIGVPDDVQKATGEIEQDETFSESDVSKSASELDGLREEAKEAAEKATNAMQEDPPSPTPSQTSSLSSSATPTLSDYQQNTY